MLLKNFLRNLKNSRYLKTKDAGIQEIQYKGLTIVIENPVGSIRSGEDKHGDKWKTKFLYPYGYIKYTKGADNEGIDCFIGNDDNAEKVYLIHQRIHNRYDEDKVMIGFPDEESARDAYLAHYNTQCMLGPITKMDFEQFKQFLGLNE